MMRSARRVFTADLFTMGPAMSFSMVISFGKLYSFVSVLTSLFMSQARIGRYRLKNMMQTFLYACQTP